MSNKKSGYAYLKEKVAKLEKENCALKCDYEDACEQCRKLHDKLDDAKNALGKEHALRVRAENDLIQANKDLKFVTQMRDNICERYVWLWEHAPFWLKWWFHRKFNKQK